MHQFARTQTTGKWPGRAGTSSMEERVFVRSSNGVWNTSGHSATKEPDVGFPSRFSGPRPGWLPIMIQLPIATHEIATNNLAIKEKPPVPEAGVTTSNKTGVLTRSCVEVAGEGPKTEQGGDCGPVVHIRVARIRVERDGVVLGRVGSCLASDWSHLGPALGFDEPLPDDDERDVPGACRDELDVGVRLREI